MSRCMERHFLGSTWRWDCFLLVSRWRRHPCSMYGKGYALPTSRRVLWPTRERCHCRSSCGLWSWISWDLERYSPIRMSSINREASKWFVESLTSLAVNEIWNENIWLNETVRDKDNYLALHNSLTDFSIAFLSHASRIEMKGKSLDSFAHNPALKFPQFSFCERSPRRGLAELSFSRFCALIKSTRPK